MLVLSVACWLSRACRCGCGFSWLSLLLLLLLGLRFAASGADEIWLRLGLAFGFELKLDAFVVGAGVLAIRAVQAACTTSASASATSGTSGTFSSALVALLGLCFGALNVDIDFNVSFNVRTRRQVSSIFHLSAALVLLLLFVVVRNVRVVVVG